MNKTKAQDVSGASWNYAEVWDKFPIPARPCKKELDIIEKKISQFNGKPEVLILGSTIEYRSLCKRLGIRPVVADFSRDNFLALTEYSAEKFEDEAFVESDWLKLNYENTFDFILGHRIFNVIEKKEIGHMFKVMHRALKDNGIFFCRGNVFDSSFSDRVEEFVDKWAFIEKEHPLFTYLEVALYMKCKDSENYVDYPECRRLVDKWYHQKRISREEYEHIKLLVSMSDDARFRTALKEEVVEGYRYGGFRSAEWLTTDDEFSEHMPIIMLTK